MIKKAILMAAVLFIAVIAGCTWGARSAPTQTVAPGIDDAAVKGEELYTYKRCNTCHGANGEGVASGGPALKGIAGSRVELDTGERITADDAYLMESIKDPNAKFVKGYPKGTMASIVASLTDEDIKALVAYIKTLK